MRAQTPHGVAVAAARALLGAGWRRSAPETGAVTRAGVEILVTPGRLRVAV